MRSIVLKKPSGFVIINRNIPVKIRDSRGILQYSTESRLPKAKVFNLPKGHWFVDGGSFRPLGRMIRYKLAPLPSPERAYFSPSDFHVVFGLNPNKCTVFWDKKIILFDESLKEKPRYILFYILYHEFGHKLYRTEKYADLYASNMMKLRGYNPNQIAKSPLHSLSPAQYDRKVFIIKQLIKNNSYT